MDTSTKTHQQELVTAARARLAQILISFALQAELPGYGGFTHQVRFRLMPGIW